jgi:hypothetical protein
MKKLIYFILVFSLLLPFIGFAAYNDVTLTTDTVISVNGISLNVSGSSSVIESMTVNANDFTVTLQSNSTFQVTSSARKKFFVDAPGTVTISRPCTSSESSLTLSGASNVTVTISPSSSACDAADSTTTSTSSTIAGGAAPGTAASFPNVLETAEEAVLAVEEAPAPVSGLTLGQISSIIILLEAFEVEPSVIDTVRNILKGTRIAPAPSAVSVSPVFNTTLKFGMISSDVKRLQQLLNSDPDTQLASSGVGSPGNETDYFGALTRKAVQKFQAKYGIISSGDEASTGYGLAGPKTRAKLAEVFGR